MHGVKKVFQLLRQLVIAYKDRLTRFGYDLIEDIIRDYSNGEIVVINKNIQLKPEDELAFDVLQIMNVFVAKMNGLRKYSKNRK